MCTVLQRPHITSRASQWRRHCVRFDAAGQASGCAVKGLMGPVESADVLVRSGGDPPGEVRANTTRGKRRSTAPYCSLAVDCLAHIYEESCLSRLPQCCPILCWLSVRRTSTRCRSCGKCGVSPVLRRKHERSAEIHGPREQRCALAELRQRKRGGAGPSSP